MFSIFKKPTELVISEEEANIYRSRCPYCGEQRLYYDSPDSKGISNRIHSIEKSGYIFDFNIYYRYHCTCHTCNSKWVTSRFIPNHLKKKKKHILNVQRLSKR